MSYYLSKNGQHIYILLDTQIFFHGILDKFFYSVYASFRSQIFWQDCFTMSFKSNTVEFLCVYICCYMLIIISLFIVSLPKKRLIGLNYIFALILLPNPCIETELFDFMCEFNQSFASLKCWPTLKFGFYKASLFFSQIISIFS